MGGPRRTVRRPAAYAAAAALAIPLLAAGCSDPAHAPRPTDPHQIVSDAVKATAALPSVRVHVELVSTIPQDVRGVANRVPMRSSMALDADIDLATRQLAGRTTTVMTGGGGAAIPAGGQQTADVIMTANAVFFRSGGGRWTKSDSGGLQVGPTNAAIATAIVGLLDDARITYDSADPVECGLGTCDHVIVHVNGAAAFAAVAALAGVPNDPASAAGVPNVDVDVRVAQSSSVISELRHSLSMNGQTTQLLLSLSNPGEPVQIVPPPAGLVDDISGQVNKVLETVGNELETPHPVEVEPEPSLAP
jgi:hypothetical protein